MGKKSGALAKLEPKLLKGGVTAIKAVYTVMEVYFVYFSTFKLQRNSMGPKTGALA